MSQPTPPETGYAVVPLTNAHLKQALALSQALNWPYRAEDWQFALDLGHGYAVESEEKLVGTALWWPYGAKFASAGMIIVAAQAQRQGIGARLMDALLADAKDRNIILNSTPQGQKLYSRLGFTPYSAIRQHQAVLDRAPSLDPSISVRTATPEDRAAIHAIDRAASGMDRGPVLDALLTMATTVIHENAGEIAGYACVRRWGRGVVIGPVAGRDRDVAKAMIATLAKDHVGGFVRIDVTEPCGLSAWLDSIGLPQVDQEVSMVRGEAPVATADTTLFALSNQSLG